jgi:hypothetical protein
LFAALPFFAAIAGACCSRATKPVDSVPLWNRKPQTNYGNGTFLQSREPQLQMVIFSDQHSFRSFSDQSFA